MSDLAAVLQANPNWRKRRLILHAGTPKTGTTSVQFALDRVRKRLAAAGVLYPREGTDEGTVPKHQWIVASPARPKGKLAERLARCLAEGDDETQTLILSAEGIYNHWWGYSAEERLQLSVLSDFFDTCILLWFREPVSYYKSQYVQYLRNPRIPGFEAFSSDRSPRDILSIPWVSGHFNYLPIIRDMESVFGDKSVFAFFYRGHTVEDVCSLIGIDAGIENVERQNVGDWSATGVDLLRIVNRLELNSAEKTAVVEKLEELDDLLKSRTLPFTLSDDVIAEVKSLCPLTRQDLLAIDADSRERWAARASAFQKGRLRA